MPRSVWLTRVSTDLSEPPALELPRGLRMNVVSPVWVKETLQAMGMDGSGGMPAQHVALAYVASVEGKHNGEVIDPRTSRG